MTTGYQALAEAFQRIVGDLDDALATIETVDGGRELERVRYFMLIARLKAAAYAVNQGIPIAVKEK